MRDIHAGATFHAASPSLHQSSPGRLFACLLLTLLAGGQVSAAEPSAEVSVHDSGSQIKPVTFECTAGHRAETRLITLDSGAAKYTFRYCGCTDPSHGDQRPAAEGNFGMPEPTTANWYWGGFLNVLINGQDATRYRLADLRVTETGTRGAFQILWSHPDAEVGLRLTLLPGANHVLTQLVWRPAAQATVRSVVVRLTCYPSFFTAAQHRQGERHCQTPRVDQREPQVLELVPDQDPYLYFYDTVFDVARQEGAGPCAVVVAPGAVQSGRVQIGGYAVVTELALKPEAGQFRLALYDFTGHRNAAAEAYLKAHAAADLARLVQTDFRPEAVRQLQVDRLRAETSELLAAAAEDGQPYRAKTEELLARAAALRAAAEQGDWKAEADLATLLAASADLFWKLKALAALNRSP